MINNVDAENIPLDVLYEDENIVINKPQGMVVPGSRKSNGTFVNGLLYHLGSTNADLIDSVKINTSDEQGDGLDLPETPEAAAAVAESLRPGVVHRLDKHPAFSSQAKPRGR